MRCRWFSLLESLRQYGWTESALLRLSHLLTPPSPDTQPLNETLQSGHRDRLARAITRRDTQWLTRESGRAARKTRSDAPSEWHWSQYRRPTPRGPPHPIINTMATQQRNPTTVLNLEAGDRLELTAEDGTERTARYTVTGILGAAGAAMLRTRHEADEPLPAVSGDADCAVASLKNLASDGDRFIYENAAEQRGQFAPRLAVTIERLD